EGLTGPSRRARGPGGPPRPQRTWARPRCGSRGSSLGTALAALGERAVDGVRSRSDELRYDRRRGPRPRTRVDKAREGVGGGVELIRSFSPLRGADHQHDLPSRRLVLVACGELRGGPADDLLVRLGQLAADRDLAAGIDLRE